MMLKRDGGVHGQELPPVEEKAVIEVSRINDQPPQLVAPGLLPQGNACFTLRHIIAHIDQLDDKQVQQRTSHDAAVPTASEAQRRAEHNTNMMSSIKQCISFL